MNTIPHHQNMNFNINKHQNKSKSNNYKGFSSIYQDLESRKIINYNNTNNLFKTTKEIIRKNTPNHITAAKFIQIIQQQNTLSDNLSKIEETKSLRKSYNKG